MDLATKKRLDESAQVIASVPAQDTQTTILLAILAKLESIDYKLYKQGQTGQASPF